MQTDSEAHSDQNQTQEKSFDMRHGSIFHQGEVSDDKPANQESCSFGAEKQNYLSANLGKPKDQPMEAVSFGNAMTPLTENKAQAGYDVENGGSFAEAIQEDSEEHRNTETGVIGVIGQQIPDHFQDEEEDNSPCCDDD